MDGVKRYHLYLTGVRECERGDYVLYSDFDAALAREAALRGELRNVRIVAESIQKDLFERLTAAQFGLAALREENQDALAVNRTLNAQMDALREELANVKRSRADELENYNALVTDMTAAEQRNESLLDIARGLTIQLHATIGNTEFHEDCIRDLEALEAGNAEN